MTSNQPNGGENEKKRPPPKLDWLEIEDISYAEAPRRWWQRLWPSRIRVNGPSAEVSPTDPNDKE